MLTGRFIDARRHAMTGLTDKTQSGFTLLEAIVAMLITGIVASMVAVFMRVPVQGYVDTANRAELTDAADTALRRMARDIRLALPNSIRVNATGNAVEFLLTSTGGRYLDISDAPAGNFLNFTNASDTDFVYIGSPLPINQGDQIVVYNLGLGNPNNDAYTGANRASVDSVNGSLINLTSNPFALGVSSSPFHRFQVVTTPVTFGCADGQLRRYWGYAIPAAQAFPPVGAQSAVLADGVSTCVFSYGTPVQVNSQLMGLSLTMQRNGESVSLFHQIHVVNLP
jgi:MSHA biogenesis protein MshO